MRYGVVELLTSMSSCDGVDLSNYRAVEHTLSILSNATEYLHHCSPPRPELEYSRPMESSSEFSYSSYSTSTHYSSAASGCVSVSSEPIRYVLARLMLS